MIFSAIWLKNFRNYADLNLEFSPKLNVFVGSNAQGKTNLLEAISLLSASGTFRNSKDSDLITWGEGGCRVAARVESEAGSQLLELRLSREARRTVLVNGNRVRGASHFSEYAASVNFTPDDLQLVKGSPVCRRKVLDTDLVQASPSYRDLLARYTKVVQQRNNLLRQWGEGRRQPGDLAVWDEQLVDLGSRIMARRKLAVDELSETANIVHREMTRGSERLTIRYVPFYLRISELSNRSAAASNHDTIAAQPALTEGALIQRYEEAMRTLIPRMRALERTRGMSLLGPHRDDLSYLINDVDARDFGSQGQQRTAVLAFKLAELRFLDNRRGDRPVMLLDDVFSELDEKRRFDFLGLLGSTVQAFITTTHLGSLPDHVLRGARLFTVAGGRILREG